MEPDYIDLNNVELLKDRDRSFRTVIEHKKYDTSHEDDLCRILVKNDRWGSMLLIRYEYYLSKTYHQLGKGDLVFWDQKNSKLYAVELKSLKDKYSSTTDQSKVDKCIEQSLKYAEQAKNWCGQKAIPVTVIEYSNGEIVVEERHQQVLRPPVQNVWQGCEFEQEKWFNHPGDQTDTRYRISGDTLEAERTVDYEPSSGSRKSFRKRVQKVAKECTKCTKYYLTMKNLNGDILMNEIKPIDDEIA